MRRVCLYFLVIRRLLLRDFLNFLVLLPPADGGFLGPLNAVGNLVESALGTAVREGPREIEGSESLPIPVPIELLPYSVLACDKPFIPKIGWGGIGAT